MAAARPVLASIDAGTAVPKILAESGGGLAVAPGRSRRVRGGPARAARRPGRRRGHGATGPRLGRARGVAGRRRRRIPPAHRLAAPLNPLHHEPPIASHARGTLLVIHQESRQAREVGPGQEGPVPGRNDVPPHRRDRRRPRPRARRVRTSEPAGRRCVRADHRRPLAHGVRVLPVRHLGAGHGQQGRSAGARLRRVRPHRHPQPRRRRRPLAPVHRRRRSARGPSCRCSSTCTASS